jgi:hypothetical protein
MSNDGKHQWITVEKLLPVSIDTDCQYGRLDQAAPEQNFSSKLLLITAQAIKLHSVLGISSSPSECLVQSLPSEEFTICTTI